MEQNATENIVDYIRRCRSQSSQELSQEKAVKLCMSGLHPWIGFQLQGASPRTFEQLSSTATNLKLYLAANPRLLATLKAGSEVNKPCKTMSIKNIAEAKVSNNNAGTRNREPNNGISLGAYKAVPLPSSDSKGKEKVIVLGREEEAQHHPP